ncbi:MAG: hypothetical protein ACI8W3_001069, partial [Myxococcota bacterium]
MNEQSTDDNAQPQTDALPVSNTAEQPSAQPRDPNRWSRRLDLLSKSTAGGDAKAATAPGEDPNAWELIRPEAQEQLPTENHADTPPQAASAQEIASDDRTEASLDASVRDILDRNAESVGLRAALGASNQQLRSREAEIHELTTKLAVANATTNARHDDLAALTARLAGTEEKLNATEREAKLLHDKIQRAGQQADKREIKIENLRATRGALEETLKARDRLIQARDGEISACNQEISAVRDRSSAHQKAITERDADIALLSDQLLAEQERGRRLEAEIGAREQVASQHRDKLVRRDDQLASLLATLDVVERTVASRPVIGDLEARSTPSLAPVFPTGAIADDSHSERFDAAAHSVREASVAPTVSSSDDTADTDESQDSDEPPVASAEAGNAFAAAAEPEESATEFACPTPESDVETDDEVDDVELSDEDATACDENDNDNDEAPSILSEGNDSIETDTEDTSCLPFAE